MRHYGFPEQEFFNSTAQFWLITSPVWLRVTLKPASMLTMPFFCIVVRTIADSMFSRAAASAFARSYLSLASSARSLLVWSLSCCSSKSSFSFCL